MRSLLFVPAHKEDLIKKAVKTDADALIFDLEDSCPERFHDKGIENTRKYDYPVKIVRIRRLEDIKPLMRCVTYFLIPKAEKAVEFTVKTLALIETARGVINAPAIAQKCQGLVFGNEDYFADTGCKDYLFAKSVIVNGARAANVWAIDTVFVGVHNIIGFRVHCQKALKVGFDGVLCLTPKQVTIANEVFTPSLDEYAHAVDVVTKYDKAEKEGHGVAIVDGVYVAPPMVKRARKVIEKFERYA